MDKIHETVARSLCDDCDELLWCVKHTGHKDCDRFTQKYAQTKRELAEQKGGEG